MLNVYVVRWTCTLTNYLYEDDNIFVFKKIKIFSQLTRRWWLRSLHKFESANMKNDNPKIHQKHLHVLHNHVISNWTCLMSLLPRIQGPRNIWTFGWEFFMYRTVAYADDRTGKCDECVMLPSIPNFSGVRRFTQSDGTIKSKKSPASHNLIGSGKLPRSPVLSYSRASYLYLNQTLRSSVAIESWQLRKKFVGDICLKSPLTCSTLMLNV